MPNTWIFPHDPIYKYFEDSEIIPWLIIYDNDQTDKMRKGDLVFLFLFDKNDSEFLGIYGMARIVDDLIDVSRKGSWSDLTPDIENPPKWTERGYYFFTERIHMRRGQRELVGLKLEKIYEKINLIDEKLLENDPILSPILSSRDFRFNNHILISEVQGNRLKALLENDGVSINEKESISASKIIDVEDLIKQEQEDEKTASRLSDAELKKRAKQAMQKPPVIAHSKHYVRDQYVTAHVKRRAEGKCELCGANAPFIDKDGKPFLECHHIKQLAEGGPDVIENAVALCPNCHRKTHYVPSPEDLAKLKKVAAE